jgi:hypothetical protein
MTRFRSQSYSLLRWGIPREPVSTDGAEQTAPGGGGGGGGAGGTLCIKYAKGNSHTNCCAGTGCWLQNPGAGCCNLFDFTVRPGCGGAGGPFSGGRGPTVCLPTCPLPGANGGCGAGGPQGGVGGLGGRCGRGCGSPFCGRNGGCGSHACGGTTAPGGGGGGGGGGAAYCSIGLVYTQGGGGIGGNGAGGCNGLAGCAKIVKKPKSGIVGAGTTFIYSVF